MGTNERGFQWIITGDDMGWKASTVMLVALLVYTVLERWDEPDCKDGYVATHDLVSRWACVPGYRPLPWEKLRALPTRH
jgi:hypothetical protein